MIEQITSALRSQIPARDIQVLAPMYKGQAGIDNINTLMQDLLNPAVKDQVVFETPDCQYRDGDKVIHLVNDAKVMSFNGDIGYITDLLPENIQNRSKMNWLSNLIMKSSTRAMNGTRFA